MNIRLIKKSIEYSTEIVNEVKRYAEFMDKYFEDEKNIKEHYEIYMAYKSFDEQLRIKAQQKGLIK